ncbi:MAG TPA: hypothetical protein VL381_06695 [Rhodocyclaceae bacterium]|nr:hypothetical protein [Rhodocyclaceae bacterium]
MTQTSEPNKAQEMRPPVIFLSIIVAMLAGIYFWSEHRAKAPIDPTYEQYVQDVSNASKAAFDFRAVYFSDLKRDTIASEDFILVCAGMTKAAQAEGIDTAKFGPNISSLCENSPPYLPLERNTDGETKGQKNKKPGLEIVPQQVKDLLKH